MKPTHLITLSELVTELNENLLSGIDQSKELELIKNWNNKLKGIVTLAHFVPCDKNGVPLEDKAKRKCTQSQCIIHDACGACSCSVDYQQELNEAQKSVIFEGWEVFSINDYVIKVVKDNWLVGFCLKNKWVTITTLEAFNKNDWDSALNIQSLADLAAATTENPLKLKQ